MNEKEAPFTYERTLGDSEAEKNATLDYQQRQKHIGETVLLESGKQELLLPEDGREDSGHQKIPSEVYTSAER